MSWEAEEVYLGELLAQVVHLCKWVSCSLDAPEIFLNEEIRNGRQTSMKGSFCKKHRGGISFQAQALFMQSAHEARLCFLCALDRILQNLEDDKEKRCFADRQLRSYSPATSLPVTPEPAFPLSLVLSSPPCSDEGLCGGQTHTRPQLLMGFSGPPCPG